MWHLPGRPRYLSNQEQGILSCLQSYSNPTLAFQKVPTHTCVQSLGMKLPNKGKEQKEQMKGEDTDVSCVLTLLNTQTQTEKVKKKHTK